jgi:hypothetical protein
LTLLGAFLSAFGVSFFAAKTLSELGDWGVLWQQNPHALIIALLVTIGPLAVAWGAIWLIEKGKDGYSHFLRLVWMTVLAWGWLYIGLVVLGLMRLQ